MNLFFSFLFGTCLVTRCIVLSIFKYLNRLRLNFTSPFFYREKSNTFSFEARVLSLYFQIFFFWEFTFLRLPTWTSLLTANRKIPIGFNFNVLISLPTPIKTNKTYILTHAHTYIGVYNVCVITYSCTQSKNLITYIWANNYCLYLIYINFCFTYAYICMFLQNSFCRKADVINTQYALCKLS